MPVEAESKSRSSAATTMCDSALPGWLKYLSLEMAGDVSLVSSDGERWKLINPRGSIAFRLPAGKLRTVFSRLSKDGWTMLELIPELEDSTDVLSVTEQLHRLWRGGLLVQALRFDGKLCATLHSYGETPLLPPLIKSSDPVVLTEDACIRKQGSALVLESVESGALVRLEDSQAFQVVGALASPIECQELARRAGLSREVITALVAWLVCIGVTKLYVEEPSSSEQSIGWAFADKLLHARSRSGRHVGGYGGTFRLQGKVAEPSPVRPARGGQRIQLQLPDLEGIAALDPPLTAVLEKRRSERDHGQDPITCAELSEFLYRTARVKRRFSLGGSEFIARPFPSAGGLYEIEFYILINQCEGLRPSLYYYDGLNHCLEHVSEATKDTRQIILDAVQSSGSSGEPHLIIILAARFPRVNWKYESIAYALVLKDVGVIYQTMYLVATAMGLAPCALGGGSALSFCRAAGVTFWQESAVGEFMLGRAAVAQPQATAYQADGAARQN